MYTQFTPLAGSSFTEKTNIALSLSVIYLLLDVNVSESEKNVATSIHCVKYYRVQGINQLFHHSSVSRGIPGVTGARVQQERSDQHSTAAHHSKAVPVNN